MKYFKHSKLNDFESCEAFILYANANAANHVCDRDEWNNSSNRNNNSDSDNTYSASESIIKVTFCC